MSFETISLLLHWMEMGVLLAILFRLSNTFQLIANTQRELRRAIHQLGGYSTAEAAARSALHEPESAPGFRARQTPVDTGRLMRPDDLAGLPL
jgi:hypothetical protein